jgi:hypothetical protein
VQFGESEKANLDLIVAAVEAGDDMTTVLHAVPAAPEIDTLTDALIVPGWDGRVGDILDPDTTQPGVPIVESIGAHVSGGVIDGLVVLLRPASTPPVTVASYQIRHKLDGAGSWAGTATASAGAGGVEITGYVSGNLVAMERRAISVAGIASSWQAMTAYEVPDTPPVPGAVSGASFVGQQLGHIEVQCTTPFDEAVSRLRLWVGTTNVFADATRVRQIAAEPGATLSISYGDKTPVNLLVNPGFVADSDWTKGTGWTISGGQAQHASGSSSVIQQAVAALSAAAIGAVMRYGLTVAAFSGVSVVPRLIGGSTINGTAATSTGIKFGTIAKASGNTDFGISAGSTTTATVDDLVLFQETPGCLSQGQRYVWLTVANSEGEDGPETALGLVTVY